MSGSVQNIDTEAVIFKLQNIRFIFIEVAAKNFIVTFPTSGSFKFSYCMAYAGQC